MNAIDLILLMKVTQHEDRILPRPVSEDEPYWCCVFLGVYIVAMILVSVVNWLDH